MGFSFSAGLVNFVHDCAPVHGRIHLFVQRERHWQLLALDAGGVNVCLLMVSYI